MNTNPLEPVHLVNGELSASRLLELIPVALYTCEAPSGRITFYNAMAATLWGREPSIGSTDERFCGSFKLWLPDGSPLPHHETPMAVALLEGRAARNQEVIIERPDGSRLTVIVNIDPILDRAGRVIGAINVFHDFTTLKQVDETRARLAAIVESSEDAIVSTDPDGIITSWNEGAERLFGYAASEAIGRSVTMLMPAHRQTEEPGILARIRRGERIDHYETVRLRRDGTTLDVSLTLSPIRDRTGAVIGTSKIARDITERKAHEEQRSALLSAALRSREAADAANRGKDEFLAMLGHELRNPLAAVANAVAAATLDETNRTRALVIAARQTHQLARIVDDLLDVARITQGHIPLEKRRVPLARILQRTIDAARGLFDERSHTLAVSLPPESVEVEADPARLEQAIANLLSNAAKYTDPGGIVTVAAEQSDQQVTICVQDNGAGISSDLLPRVFDLFAQGDRTLERSQGGLGIGLTLVRRIVELHGGGVEARSAGIGRGSEFIIRLPVAPAASERLRMTVEKTAPVPLNTPARVLVVEDHEDAAETLVMALEFLGHHVQMAGEGAAALSVAQAGVPDIMLIDIGLPGMNGYELARAIRRDPALTRVVLVALTGYGRPEDIAKASAAGFNHHLVKPVDHLVLGDVIARLVRSRRRDPVAESAS